MKREFFDYLIPLMKERPDIYFISAGLGWPRTDEMKQFKDRYIQTEAAEQTALDIAVGLAYAGKIPIVYTITPFLYRGFETIRTYINHESLNIVLIGVGRDSEYSESDGFSHFAGDDHLFMRNFENINSYWPVDIEGMKNELKNAIDLRLPTYINLKR